MERLRTQFFSFVAALFTFEYFNMLLELPRWLLKTVNSNRIWSYTIYFHCISIKRYSRYHFVRLSNVYMIAACPAYTERYIFFVTLKSHRHSDYNVSIVFVFRFLHRFILFGISYKPVGETNRCFTSDETRRKHYDFNTIEYRKSNETENHEN